MSRVVVVGAGVAGQAAALAALERGAEVTVLERSGSLPLRKKAWPGLISGEVSLTQLEREAKETLGRLAAADFRFSESAEGVDLSNKRARTLRSPITFASLVIATGTLVRRAEFRGSSKKNVYLMAELDSYLKLAEGLPDISTIAISGASPLALGVAETLAKQGKRVILFATGACCPRRSTIL